MRGTLSLVLTLGVIVAVVLVSARPLMQIDQQQERHQSEQTFTSATVATSRIGYDYPAPPNLVTPYQDHDENHHEGHLDDHHDPGYWKKRLTWKEGWKKIWQRGKKKIWIPKWKKYWKPYWIPEKIDYKEAWKQIWLRDYKYIWVPGVKKIFKPVWISEWFPSPDHHEHIHDDGLDRSDKNADDVGQKSEDANQIEDRVDDHHDHHDPGYWKKKLIWKEGVKQIWQQVKKPIWRPSWKKIWKPIVIPKQLKWKEAWKQIWVGDYKDIWIPGVKKIWKPVIISEWFPSPDHHHESHGWDRSDNNAAASQQPAVTEAPTVEQVTPKQPQESTWQFPK